MNTSYIDRPSVSHHAVQGSEDCSHHDQSVNAYAYSSMCGDGLPGSFCSLVESRRDFLAGLSTRGLRCRRSPTGVDDVEGVSGLMLSSVPICLCLNQRLLTGTIGSVMHVFEGITRHARPGVMAKWLLSVYIYEDLSFVSGSQ